MNTKKYIYVLDPNDRDRVLLSMTETQFERLPADLRATLRASAPLGGFEYGPSSLDEVDPSHLQGKEISIKRALVPEGGEETAVQSLLKSLIPLFQRVRPTWLALVLTALAGALGTLWPYIIQIFG